MQRERSTPYRLLTQGWVTWLPILTKDTHENLSSSSRSGHRRGWNAGALFVNNGSGAIKLEKTALDKGTANDDEPHAANLPVETSPSEKREANFTAQLAHDLYHHVHQHNVKSVVLVADPHTLGQLRKALHSEVSDKVTGELHKTLTGASLNDIEHSLTAAAA